MNLSEVNCNISQRSKIAEGCFSWLLKRMWLCSKMTFLVTSVSQKEKSSCNKITYCFPHQKMFKCHLSCDCTTETCCRSQLVPQMAPVRSASGLTTTGPKLFIHTCARMFEAGNHFIIIQNYQDSKHWLSQWPKLRREMVIKKWCKDIHARYATLGHPSQKAKQLKFYLTGSSCTPVWSDQPPFHSALERGNPNQQHTPTTSESIGTG